MKRPTVRGRYLAACVAAALALSACGSSKPQANNASSGAKSSTTATTRAPSTTVPPGASTTAPPRTTVPTAPADPSIDGTEIDRLPTTPTSPTPVPDTPLTGQALSTFLRTTFDDIQSIWAAEFKAAGIAYSPAKLVLFTSAVSTACGTQSSDVGPFYCPGDQTVYLDQTFFAMMERQFGVTGDFAPAYVVAHEVGHHVQNLLGITGRVAAADQANPAATNGRSVQVELQADCFAGVWAHSIDQRDLLKDGDLEEALRAAAAVGDDFLQKVSGNVVEPESWTHGSSAQRQHWLTVGFDQGTPDACDTFAS